MLPLVINYALRFPAEMRTRDEGTTGAFTNNWVTSYKLGSDFSIGPRNKNDSDGGTPPGYIPVSLDLKAFQLYN